MARACYGARMIARRSLRLAPVLFVLLIAACTTPPEERLTQARAAAADKDMDAFSKFFTQHSANFLRDMVRTAARSKIPYIKDPFKILPEGDIESVTTEGLSTLIKVKGKRSSDEIRMFMENDEWSIDVYSLKALWAPLAGGGS